MAKMIDVHCHFDMMPNPEAYIKVQEAKGNITIGMTNLPSHYKMGAPYVGNYKHIRLALGFHPQLASSSTNELKLFEKLVDHTSYIGEIGLDFSREYYHTKDIQIECLREILGKLHGKRKIISVHSRQAERTLLDLLKEYNIKNVIFHWYSGPINLIKEIVNEGYFFSINGAMIASENGKKIISAIPKDRILTETDAPYNIKTSVGEVLEYLNIGEDTIENNFKCLLSNLHN